MKILLCCALAVGSFISPSMLMAQSTVRGEFKLPSSYSELSSGPTNLMLNARAAQQVTLFQGGGSVAGLTHVLRYKVGFSDGQVKDYYAAADSLVAKIRSGADPAKFAAEMRGTVEPLGIANLYLVRLPAPSRDGIELAIATAAELPEVEYAEPNWIQFALKKRPAPTVRDARRRLRATTPNDTNVRDQWYLNNTGQTGGAADSDIDAFEAWDVQTGAKDVVVAVIDTGIDYRHPDLAANVWNNPKEIGTDLQGRDKRTNGVDDDANGYIDDWRGWDFDSNDNDPLDANGHGTHVAGTVAAVTNNGRGVAGVSWNAKVMALQFLGPEGGTTANAIKAVAYAARNGATLTNNSWGGGAFNNGLLDAIETSKQLFVAAAGNNGANNDAVPFYPASYESDYVIAVAATDHNDKLGYFSNYGATSVDIGAPGVDIYSTWLNGTYGRLDGTSMAAPTVSGALSILKSQMPAMGPLQLKARLLGKADPVAGLTGKVATGARLNVANGLVATYSAEVPIGAIMPFFGRLIDIPDNWIICDGSQVHDPLSPMVGKFVPDLRARFVSGASATVPAGSVGGLAESPNHGHQIGAYSNNVSFGLNSGNGYAPSYHPATRADGFDRTRVALGAPAPSALPAPPNNNPYESHGHMNGRAYVSGAAQPGGSHDNRPPFVAMHYLIRIR